MVARKEEAWRAYKKRNNVVCNCGSSQYGTEHSPDCLIELAFDDFKAEWDDAEYAAENCIAYGDEK